MSAITSTQNIELAYSPVEELAKPTGMNPAAVINVPVSMGKAVDSQAKVAAFTRSKPCSIFTIIISTAMMASSTRSPRAIISAPSEMRCKSTPSIFMKMKTTASTRRHRQRHDDFGAGAQRGEAHQEHDNQRLDERAGEFADRFLDHSGLIGDLFDLYADWRLGAHLVDREGEILAKGEHIAAPRHNRADDDRRGAVMPGDKVRRIFVAGRYSGDVAKPQHLPAGRDGQGRVSLPRLAARLRDLQSDPSGRGFEHARVVDGVLLGHGIENRLRRYAEISQLGSAELDENLAVLIAVDIHLHRVGRRQKPLPQNLHDLIQLVIIGAIAANRVKHEVNVAIFVVDKGAFDASREIALNVMQLLAQLIEQPRHVARRRRVLKGHGYRQKTRLRVGLDLIEKGQFLEFFLQEVRDLIARLLGGRARPESGHDRDLMVKEGSSARPSF